MPQAHSHSSSLTNPQIFIITFIKIQSLLFKTQNPSPIPSKTIKTFIKIQSLSTMWKTLFTRASIKNLKYKSLSNFPQFNPKPTRTHPGFPLRRPFAISNNPNLKSFELAGFNLLIRVNQDFGFATSSAAVDIVSTEEDDTDDSRESFRLSGKKIQTLDEINNNGSNNNIRKQQRLVNGMGQGKYNALRRRQIKIETEAWENAAKEYQELLVDMCEQKLAPNLPYVKSLFLGWFEPLKNAISAEQDLCREGKNRGAYAPQFDQLPADMMTIITMHKLMGLLMTGNGQYGARVVQAAVHIGEAIEHEARIHRFMEKSKKKATLNESPDDESETVSDKQQMQKLRKKVNVLVKKKKLQQVRHIVKQQDDLKPWGQDAQVKVGSRLIQLLMETAYIQPPVEQFEDCPPDIRPAFVHTLRTVETPRGSRRYGVIECDPLVRRGLEKSAMHMVIPYMPMLLPPVNWTGYNRGGYLFLPSYLMRTHGAKQQRDVVKHTPRKQLGAVFEALNTLGATKWRVNKKVLDVVDRIWASGGRLADLVDRDDVAIPEEPDTEDETELKKWKWKVKSAKKENRERHSQRCDIELKLAVARKMKNEEGFYYPHNLDFRGRAYPMHPYLNHLGSDLCRGVLEFAEGRPLGESGLKWLKIHLANVYGGGVDKLSYEGRMSFTENHLDDIFDSSDRPLEGKRWWLKAEDPFQCLATCINLSEALRSSSPETILSHTPIHQDGSCNGLQHYAALGRDKLGAAAVNLVEGEKPADVYSGIASRVIEIMRRDAEGDPLTDQNAKHARLLVDQVDRKLVKQTVMTSVYGVTYIGARDQIKRRLKERCAIEDDAELFAAACYAAKITLTALGEMFEAARSIMSWLGDCARVIAMKNHSVQWVTPLGLPVVQPYRKLGRHLIKTSLQVLTLQRETDKVMVKRQRTAFPPNFVHSLDGSHMMMTAIACKEAGLSFAGVHDSFWTHACDVDQMNQILREKFVELYEAPILANILESGSVQLTDLQTDHKMSLEYIIYTMIKRVRNTTPDDLNIHFVRILLCLMKFPKAQDIIVSAVHEGDACTHLVELLNNPNEQLQVVSIVFSTALSPFFGNILADRLCRTRGQPHALLTELTESTAPTQKQAVSVNFLAKLPHENLSLNLALLNTVPLILKKLDHVQRSGARMTKYGSVYLEGLVGILVRFTSTLHDHHFMTLAKTFNFTAVFTDLLMNTFSDEIQKLSANGLENLSSKTVTLSKPPQIKTPKINKFKRLNKFKTFKKLKELYLQKCFKTDSSNLETIPLCSVHKGVCSSQETYCLVEAKAVDKLLTCFDHNNVQVVEAALSAICTLLDERVDLDTSVSILIQEKAIKHLLNVIKAHKNESLREKIFWVLEKLLKEGDESSTSEISQDKFLRATLINVLHYGNGDIRLMAEKILRHLT